VSLVFPRAALAPNPAWTAEGRRRPQAAAGIAAAVAAGEDAVRIPDGGAIAPIR
jgi:hypothetical protein